MFKSEDEHVERTLVSYTWERLARENYEAAVVAWEEGGRGRKERRVRRGRWEEYERCAEDGVGERGGDEEEEMTLEECERSIEDCCV